MIKFKQAVSIAIIILITAFSYCVKADGTGSDRSVDVWDGSIAETFKYGNGTVENPYKITTASELALLSYNVNNGVEEYNTACYCLDTDIDLNNINWTPIGYRELASYETDYSYTFRGIFDGRGCTVKNLKITESKTNYCGLFGMAYNAKIYNTNIKNSNIDLNTDILGGWYCGLIAGMGSDVEIDSCNVQGSIRVQCERSANVGGLASSVYGKIKFCNSNVDIQITTPINNSETYGACCGGLVGNVKGSVERCSSRGKIVALSHNVESGGLTATLIGSVTDCYTTGDVYGQCVRSKYGGEAYAGGLVGIMINDSIIKNCYTTGNITSVNSYGASYSGGILGRHSDNKSQLYFIKFIEKSFSMGNVASSGNMLSKTYAAPIVGDSSAEKYDFLYCYYNSLSKITKNGYETSSNTIGYSTNADNFTSEKWLSELDFDTKNTWIVSDSYPTLKPKAQEDLFSSYYAEETRNADNIEIDLRKILDNDGILIVAFYNSNGEMVNTQYQTIDMKVNDTKTFKFKSSGYDTTSANVFVWDSIKGMKPLMSTKNITLTQ